VCWGANDGRIQIQTPRDETVLRSLETACAAAKLPLRVLLFLTGGEKIRWYDATAGREVAGIEDENALGYIFRNIGAVTSVDPDALLHYIVSQRKPVAMLDEEGDDLVFAKKILSHRMLRVFPVGVGGHEGALMGKYVLDCGHTQAAFFSAYHKASFSKNRLDGIASVFSHSGVASHISVYTCDSFQSPWDHYVCAVRATRNGITDTPEEVKEQIIREHLLATMVPHFENALKNRETSLWVSATDDVAGIAVSWLKRKGIDVPRRLSVAGFDDSFDALREGIATYNFNIPAVIDSILDYLTTPRAGKRRSKEKTVYIDGFVIPRRSLREKKRERNDG
jgi:DNA-binding LacI/PurR family transcriptional regulator